MNLPPIDPRPPLGLKPKSVHDAQRKGEILQAMARYALAGKPIPFEWVAELADLYEAPVKA